MNEQQYLESVTRRAADETSADKPTAGQPADDKPQGAPDGLRESWLLLGQLLDAAVPRIDESAVVLAVGRRVRRRRQLTVGVVALAASLLIAVSVVLSRPGRELQQAQATPRGISVKSTPAVINVAWRDEVDEAMEEAQHGMASAQHGWNALPSSIDLVRSRLDELEAQLTHDTL